MNKNGFAIFTILRVISILAIVIIVTIFLVFNVMDKIRKKSFTDVSYGIVSAAELKYAHDVLTGSSGALTFKFEDRVEKNDEGKTLDYKGDKPTYGIVKIDNIGQIFIALYDGKYCATKDYIDAEITITMKKKNDCYNFD